MGTPGVHHLLGWWCFLGMASFVAGAAQTGEDKASAFPKGSEKAVAAVRAAIPKAQIDEAAEPKGFGGSGGKGTPLFWTVRFHAGKKKQELSVTPEGVIIRLPVRVEVKDLPKPVADAIAKTAPGETVKSAEKNEMRATLKYVAIDKARVQRYAIDVSKDGKTTRVVSVRTARAPVLSRSGPRRRLTSRRRKSTSPPKPPRRSERSKASIPTPSSSRSLTKSSTTAAATSAS